MGFLSPMHGSSSLAHIAIEARNVTLSLGTREAPTQILRGVDLSIPKGESLAILGPSGSGKSSLMAILSGLERASGGDVRRSEEHTSELQSLMRISYAVFCLKKKKKKNNEDNTYQIRLAH